MTTTYALPPSWTKDQKAAVCEWLTANGIDPNVVPLSGEIQVDDNGITYFEQAPGGVWTTRWAPLISPMSAALAAQLRLPPRLCPHCCQDINALSEAGAS